MFKTLIVEDHPVFRRSLNQIIRSHFPCMAIAEAGNGKDALQRIDDFQPHLVFMDINLPDGNGLKLTQSIKADHPHITVVVITTYDLPEYRNAALQMGASHFISKDALSEVVLRMLVRSVVGDCPPPA